MQIFRFRVEENAYQEFQGVIMKNNLANYSRTRKREKIRSKQKYKEFSSSIPKK